MNRLTLAGQVALIIAVAIFFAQLLNLALAVEHRRELALASSVAPAAQRLALAAERPEIIEQRDARRSARFERRFGRERPEGGRRFGRVRMMRTHLAQANPLPENAERFAEAERVLESRLEQAGVSPRTVRVATVDHERFGEHRAILVFAVELEDGRWLSLRAPGPPSVRPLALMLTLQSLLIGLLILIPALIVLRRVGGSLTQLRETATAFDGTMPAEIVAPRGPRDVRAMIEAVNAMQGRIAAMLAEKDVMLGAIGHDLRTPLTALRIEAEQVEEEETRAALVTQIEALHRQFEQILEFARTGRAVTSAEPFDGGDLVRAVAATYTERGDAVTLGEVDTATLIGDRAALRRAIANLVDNALRYAGPTAISLSANSTEASIRVSDTGPGLTAGQKELARSAFGRLDGSRNRASGGHGLGLAIVDAIARAHGGELSLEDGTPGLIAVIRLPIAA